jgi:hypothetical protein
MAATTSVAETVCTTARATTGPVPAIANGPSRAEHTRVPPPHCDTDQPRIVYLRLVRLISIWYCKCQWFMLFMTLDMPDEGTR